MEHRPIDRPGVQRGYDLWSEHYDQTANPLVYLDRRHAMQALQPQTGERILDAGCGTGWHLLALQRQGVYAVGMDFSQGMLRVAAAAGPTLRLVAADLHAPLPFGSETFDAFLCSLVSEHLRHLDIVFFEAYRTLIPGGRLVMSAFHPTLAAAGVEANFEIAGVEYRLGAEAHTTEDFCNAIQSAGFTELRTSEFLGDDAMVAAVPESQKYLGRPMLFLLEACRPA